MSVAPVGFVQSPSVVMVVAEGELPLLAEVTRPCWSTVSVALVYSAGVTAVSASLSAVTASSAIFAVVTFKSVMSAVTTESAAKVNTPALLIVASPLNAT